MDKGRRTTRAERARMAVFIFWRWGINQSRSIKQFFSRPEPRGGTVWEKASGQRSIGRGSETKDRWSRSGVEERVRSPLVRLRLGSGSRASKSSEGWIRGFAAERPRELLTQCSPRSCLRASCQKGKEKPFPRRIIALVSSPRLRGSHFPLVPGTNYYYKFIPGKEWDPRDLHAKQWDP